MTGRRRPLDMDPWEWALLWVRADENGCWLWQRSLSRLGYGDISIGGRKVLVHRLAYEQVHGPIEADLEVDHLCSVRSCINPAHIEAVTRGENVRRSSLGEVTRRRMLARTHCKNGHPWSENTYVSCRGKRVARKVALLRA